MLRLRNQRGGALEPTRKVPEFKYTDHPERREFIRTIYPYSSYFFSLIKEIPWASFTSEREGFQARTGEYPYIVIGGAAYEVYDELYPTVSPRVHDIIDPTADIDVLVAPLIITSKTFHEYPKATEKEKRDKEYPLEYDDNNALKLTPIMEDYTKWIYQQVGICIKRISYNFPQWFGEIPLPTKEISDLVYMHYISILDIEILSFHPIYVVRVNAGRGIKVQVYFYNGIMLQDIMEFLFWDMSIINRPFSVPFSVMLDPFIKDSDYSQKLDNYNSILWDDIIHNTTSNNYDPISNHSVFKTSDLLKSSDGITVNSLLYELFFQSDAIEGRYRLGHDPMDESHHKFLNHIQRIIYLLVVFEKILEEDRGRFDKADIAVIQFSIKKILLICSYYKSIVPYSHHIIAHIGPNVMSLLCKHLALSRILKKCGVKPTGGYRRTRRQRKRAQNTRKNQKRT